MDATWQTDNVKAFKNYHDPGPLQKLLRRSGRVHSLQSRFAQYFQLLFFLLFVLYTIVTS